MKNVTHLFFDLDHTLWDFDKNSAETLNFLFQKYNFNALTKCTASDFIDSFHKANRYLWKQYDENKIDKHQMRSMRIEMTFKDVNIDFKHIPPNFNNEYLSICPHKGHLIPFAKEILEQFHKKYQLYILTNGFEDIQYIKLKTSGIEHYFSKVYTAEKVGHKKPSNQYFNHILKENNIFPETCLMIGDTFETDILGAQNAGIKAIHYNPDKITFNTSASTAYKEIYSLNELLDLL